MSQCISRFILNLFSFVVMGMAFVNPVAAMQCDATVFSESDLNDAISCFNLSSTGTTVELGTNITVSATLTTINPNSSAVFELDGAGKTVASSATEGNLFEIQSGTLSVMNATISSSPNVAILATGSSIVNVYDSKLTLNGIGISLEAGAPQVTVDKSIILNSVQHAISADQGAVILLNSSVHESQATAIVVNNGSLDIKNSTISDGQSSGVYVSGGIAKIKKSTVSGNRLNGVNVNGGSMLILNSTISDNRIGVNAFNGVTSLAASTVAYNRDNGVEADGGQIKVQSSLVVKNAQGGPYSDCLQFSGSLLFVGRSGSSFDSDSSCLAFSATNAVSTTSLPGADLLPLGDTGCTKQHATSEGLGCVSVHDLLPTSIATGAGDCTATSGVPLIPAVSFDQIGESRQSSCDSGAVTATDAIPTPPGEVDIYSPYGIIGSSGNPYVEWTEDANQVATHYRVVIRKVGQTTILHNQLYSLAELESYGSIFAINLPIGLPAATYRLWIRGENSNGKGPYKRSIFFVPESSLPGDLSVISPSGTVNKNNPLIEWTADSNNIASHYRIIIRDWDNKLLHHTRYPLDAITQTQTGYSKDLGLNLTPGKYRIRIRGENRAGNGPIQRGVFLVD